MPKAPDKKLNGQYLGSRRIGGWQAERISRRKRERETETETDRHTERERERERDTHTERER